MEKKSAIWYGGFAVYSFVTVYGFVSEFAGLVKAMPSAPYDLIQATAFGIAIFAACIFAEGISQWTVRMLDNFKSYQKQRNEFQSATILSAFQAIIFNSSYANSLDLDMVSKNKACISALETAIKAGEIKILGMLEGRQFHDLIDPRTISNTLPVSDRTGNLSSFSVETTKGTYNHIVLDAKSARRIFGILP